MTDVMSQPWPDCVVPPATLDDSVVRECKRRVGALITTARYTGWVPWLSALSFETAMPQHSYVDRRTIDLLMAVSAHANGCRHCYGAVRAALQIMGYDERTITALQGEIQASHFDSKTKAMLEYTRLIVNADPAVGAQKDVLAAGGHSALEIAS